MCLGKTTPAGTLALAATSVLCALATKDAINVESAHDLESLVKPLLCERCPEIKQHLNTIQETVSAFHMGGAIWLFLGMVMKKMLENILLKYLAKPPLDAQFPCS